MLGKTRGDVASLRETQGLYNQGSGLRTPFDMPKNALFASASINFLEEVGALLLYLLRYHDTAHITLRVQL